MVASTSTHIDSRDLKILLALEQEPSLSNTQIARKMGVAPETVRLRLMKLRERGVLRPSRVITDPLLGERLQTEVEAAYVPSSLGLLRHHIIFLGIQTRDQLNRLKRLCDVHPHTHYRVVAFGDEAVLYAQFDIPPQTDIMIRDLYNALVERGACEDYRVIESRFVAGRGADLQRWDIKTNRWEIEYGRKSAIGIRLSRVESIWSEFLERCPDKSPPEDRPTPPESIDLLDLQLLRELTINAHPNFTRLAEVYDRDATTISRRVERIRRLFAPKDILYYDRTIFDLTYPQLIIGTFDTEGELNARTFHWFIDSGAIPFEMKGVTNGNDFLLYSMTPPSFAPEISEFFWEHCRDVHVYQLQLDSSYTYFFYHENYDPESGWRNDRSYVVETPLRDMER